MFNVISSFQVSDSKSKLSNFSIALHPLYRTVFLVCMMPLI